mmetsp:Transcript_24459/g.38684  ORF Transcript_24459/g.38684 Transcript_24459/m.38684 type:complete len:249 (-) Transcript_24459:190-936(-)
MSPASSAAPTLRSQRMVPQPNMCISPNRRLSRSPTSHQFPVCSTPPPPGPAAAPAEEELDTILEARDTEILALSELGLSDAWWKLHQFDEHTARKCPMGYTFGHYAQDTELEPAADYRLRQLDRVHVSKTLSPYLSSAHTAFVGRSDHKAELICCSPPVFRTNRPRFRCPTQFLEDEEVTESLQARLSELQGPIGGMGAIPVHSCCHCATVSCGALSEAKIVIIVMTVVFYFSGSFCTRMGLFKGIGT